MAAEVNEGCTSYHPYSFMDADGVAVPSVEASRYKLTAAGGVLIDWTDIAGTSASGTIEIPAEHNVAASASDLRRWLTIEATHGGGKKIVDEVAYVIKNFVGVEPAE